MGSRTVAVSLTPLLALGILGPAGTASASTYSDPPLLIRDLAGEGWSPQDLAPGDSTEWAVEVTNTGEAPVPLSVAVETLGDGALVTEPEHGLQLVIEYCPSNLSTVDSPASRTFECDAGSEIVAAGPAAELSQVDSFSLLDVGETAGVRIGIRFPTAAGNEFENTIGSLSVRFAIVGDAGEEMPPPTSAEPGRPNGDEAGSGLLPFTGADAFGLVAGAAMTAAIGLLLLVGSRWRSRRSSRSV